MVTLWLVVAAFLYWPLRQWEATYKAPLFSALLWPIMLFYMLFIMGLSFIKTKVVSYEARKKLAQIQMRVENNPRLPSWMGNKNRIEEFFAMVQAVCNKRGISVEFVRAAFTIEESRRKLSQIAGTMEYYGSSFEEQALAVCDKIQEYWNDVPKR